MYMDADMDWERETTKGVAKTNKLKCGGCGSRIKKGSEVMFEVVPDMDGNDRMVDCFCLRCEAGDRKLTEYTHEQAFEDSMGFGQE